MTAVLELTSAPVVDFPLRGEWTALNTPARRVPSHGTDFFAQRFAIDFVRLDPATGRPSSATVWRQVFTGLPATSFFAWDQPVHAAYSGKVIAIGEHWPDRTHVHTLWEFLRTTVLSLLVGPPGDDFRPLAGNFVLVEGAPGVAMYAHLRRGSIAVNVGDKIVVGTVLGAVGNSGNTTMPHLHFQLMDGPDPRHAQGRLCAFRGYERYHQGAWETVVLGIPAYLERVRAG